jgi:hypothetical protein
MRFMKDSFMVGVSSWIIKDGNYGNFRQGDHAAFALEFYAPTALALTGHAYGQTPSLLNVDSNLYRVAGQVSYFSSDWWVVDAGVLLYQKHRPPGGVKIGSWLYGEVRLGIDPFFYLQRLSREYAAPALIYDWQINRIEIQTAPLIEDNTGVMVRDPERLGWRDIDETNAWHDDDGHAEYVLHCQRLDSPPRR